MSDDNGCKVCGGPTEYEQRLCCAKCWNRAAADCLEAGWAVKTDATVDYERMRSEMKTNPVGFMLMRIDMRQLHWVRCALYADNGSVVVDLRTTAPVSCRTEFPAYLSPGERGERGDRFGGSEFSTVVVDAMVEAVNAVNGPVPITQHIAKHSRHLTRGEIGLGFVFEILQQRLKSAIGELAWPLVKILTEEQAWDRIKWIRGERVEGNPWEVGS